MHQIEYLSGKLHVFLNDMVWFMIYIITIKNKTYLISSTLNQIQVCALRL